MITSSEIRCIHCGEFKDLSCFYIRRDTGTIRPLCKACAKEKGNEWRKSNPEKAKANYTRQNNSKRASERKKAWVESNQDKRKAAIRKNNDTPKSRERKRKWASDHPEQGAQWRAKNKYKLAEMGSKQRFKLHPGRNKSAIFALYLKAELMSEMSGLKWSVDHIIPAVHHGWHHELNMHIVPLSVNFQKNRNPFWEHPIFKTWRDVPSFLWPDHLSKKYAELL